MNRGLICLIITILFFISAKSQVLTFDQGTLFNLLMEKDSLVFNLGYNHCDTVQLRRLLSDDLEFYHDQSGFLGSKEVLIQSFPNLCKMNYKASRKLIAESVQVYPLFENGKLYGAIQNGIHEFYGEEKGKPKYLTSTAKFTHVWIMEEETWKLKRILSYDHQAPGK